MPNPYWDNLEWVKNAADMLQRCPIPMDEVSCDILKKRLRAVREELMAMLILVRPYVIVWCGPTENHQLRFGEVMAGDWDKLFK